MTDDANHIWNDDDDVVRVFEHLRTQGSKNPRAIVEPMKKAV